MLVLVDPLLEVEGLQPSGFHNVISNLRVPDAVQREAVRR
jgi:hypothetical protein